jgi:hypothetical protein
MPTPTIPKGSDYFDATLYTGNGSSQAVINKGFQPDFVWAKRISTTGDHGLINVIKGGNKTLASNLTDGEGSQGWTMTFNSNGFTFPTGDSLVNGSGINYVGWNWKANGAGVTNTNGSITTTVSANTTSGFSVITYTGTGSTGTIGHGLGVAPSMIFFKKVTLSNWVVGSSSLTSWAYFIEGLNTTGTQQLGNGYFNSTAPTSSVITIGTDGNINSSGTGFVAYCWAPVAGYSAFGSYTGNNVADGTFVYLGFRPRYLMIKSISNANDWVVYDSSRNTFNAANSVLFPNSSATQSSTAPIDFVSNGFKIRDGSSYINNGGWTYMYMAFAENPFKYANAR